MQNRNSVRFGALILIVGAVIGLVISSGFDVSTTIPSPSPILPKPNVVLGSQQEVPKALLELQSMSDAFAYVADLVVPTVVSIQSTRLVSKADLEKFHDKDGLKDFFRFRIPNDFRQTGSGSGIIVSKDGYILTIVHVVDKANRLQVLLNDNREFDAQIVGLDPLTEVAVIKIDASNLPVARLGDSARMRVGDWVLAIGNPLELRSTVTAGIVSAKEREIDIMRDTFSVESFIQTDAAINPGNSGGALVNLRGEVIGINTAIATETGLNAGFGFAIPINLGKKIMEDLIHKGAVERAYLGIAMINIDKKKARALDLDRPTGVFIDRVLKGSPADEAGVKPKDVILSIGDDKITRSNQVQALVAQKSPGETVTLEVIRRGRRINLDVVLAMRETRPVEYETATTSEPVHGLGLECEDLTRRRAKDLAYSGRRGVVVSQVRERSSAAQAGIREGDIIIEIDESQIQTRKDFQEVTSLIQTGDVSIFTVVRNSEQYHFFVEIL